MEEKEESNVNEILDNFRPDQEFVDHINHFLYPQKVRKSLLTIQDNLLKDLQREPLLWGKVTNVSLCFLLTKLMTNCMNVYNRDYFKISNQLFDEELKRGILCSLHVIFKNIEEHDNGRKIERSRK